VCVELVGLIGYLLGWVSYSLNANTRFIELFSRALV
jgi:hypothetical protein